MAKEYTPPISSSLSNGNVQSEYWMNESTGTWWYRDKDTKKKYEGAQEPAGCNDLIYKATMEDIRNLSSTEISQITTGAVKGVMLYGYYQKGDTPFPIAYYLSNTTEEDDGGSVFEVGGIKLEHKFIDDIDARYYGVKEGSIDDSSERIKVLLDKAIRDNYTIELGRGTYKVNSFRDYILEGPLRINGDDAIIDFGSNKEDTRIIFKTNTPTIELDGIKFTNGGRLFVPTYSDTPVVIWNVRNCSFENIHAPVYFNNNHQDDYGPTSIFNISWVHNRITNCTFAATFGGINYSNFINFSHNYVDGILKQGGFRAGEDNPLKRNNIQNVIAIGNTIKNINAVGDEGNRGYGNGIAVFCTSAIISGNTIENITTEHGKDNEGIYGKVDDAVVTGNIIRNTDSAQGEGAINFKGNTKRLIISNNIMDGCYRGVNISSAKGEVMISNNYISNASHSGIHYQQGGFPRNIKITNNIITDISTGVYGIMYRGWGTEIDISQNTISDIGNAESTNVAGILVNTQVGDQNEEIPTQENPYVLKNLSIGDNIIKDINGAESDAIRLWAASDYTFIENVLISNNNIISCINGVRLTAPGNRGISQVDINYNKYTSINNRLRILSNHLPYVTEVYSNEFIDGKFNGELACLRFKAEANSGNQDLVTLTRADRDSGIKIKSVSGSGEPMRMVVYNLIDELISLSILTIGARRGYVGIGTDNPAEVLDVNGNLVVRGVIKGNVEVSSGTTVKRPNLIGLPIGYMWIDTTLSKPIYKLDDNTWIDATGATV